MKAVVMAGGEGSRLRPLTYRRPKPMVPIVTRPVMEHILRLLKRYGITEVIATLHYRADEIDLRPAVREAWLLAVPGFLLCREDCKGLCPVCGADKNTVDCGHTQSAPDPRFAALRDLKL